MQEQDLGLACGGSRSQLAFDPGLLFAVYDGAISAARLPVVSVISRVETNLAILEEDRFIIGPKHPFAHPQLGVRAAPLSGETYHRFHCFAQAGAKTEKRCGYRELSIAWMAHKSAAWRRPEFERPTPPTRLLLFLPEQAENA